MPARRLRASLVLLAAVTSVVTLARPASADDGNERQPQQQGSTQQDGRTVQAEAVSLSSDSGLSPRPGGGNANTGPSHYTPPPCWYQPSSSGEYQAYMRQYRMFLHHSGEDREPSSMDSYHRMSDAYDAHEGDASGRWYKKTCDDWSAAGWMNRPLWVWANPANPPAGAITPEFLSQYALAAMVLPELKPELSPKPPVRSDVNLPTWAWMPQAVTQDMVAAVPGMQVRVVAAPTSMELSTQAPADFVPSSGVCPAHNGSFGNSYRSGGTPECAVIFRKASVNAPGGYALTSTVTWTITWTVNGAPGTPALAPASVPSTSQVPVQEIQTVVTSRN